MKEGNESDEQTLALLQTQLDTQIRDTRRGTFFEVPPLYVPRFAFTFLSIAFIKHKQKEPLMRVGVVW